MKTQEKKIQNEKNSLEHKGGSYDERESCLTWFYHIKRRSSSYFISKKERANLSWGNLKKKENIYSIN